MICKWRLVGATVVGLTVGVLVAACNSGGGVPAPQSSPPATEPEATSPPEEPAEDHITDEQLSLMVLPQEDMGTEYLSFSVDPAETGFSTNEDEIADEVCEPDAVRADIERHGRLNGYLLSYSSNQRIEVQSGTFAVATEVDLYRDTAGAAASFDDDLTETRDEVGVPDCEGFTIFSVDEFTTGPIADRSLGAVVVVGDDSLRVHVTAVVFQRGPLYAFVVIGDVDPTDHRAEAEALARKLDERIQAVLSGEVSAGTDDSVSSGGQQPPITRQEAFELLPRLVLQSEDIPPGLRTLDSGTETLDDLASFSDDPAFARRLLESWEFVLGYFRVYGKDEPSGIFDLGVEVWALADEDNAEEAFIDGGLIVNFPDVEYEELPQFPEFGDDSVAFRLTGEQVGPDGTPFQAEGYEIVIRVGNFLGLVALTSPAGEASQAEAEALAAALEARMRGQ